MLGITLQVLDKIFYMYSKTVVSLMCDIYIFVYVIMTYFNQSKFLDWTVIVYQILHFLDNYKI